MTGYDAGQISRMLAERAESIATSLFPNGQREGAEWCVGSVDGEKGKSLKVHLRGDKAGKWADFATGQGGDLLDLYCAVKGADLPTALKWAKELLSIREPQFYRDPTAAPKTYQKPKPAQGTRVPKSAVLEYLTQQRGLNAETIADFQIAEVESYTFRREDVTCPAIVFPFKADGEVKLLKYLGTKRTDEGKKLIDTSPQAEPVLFGWQAFRADEPTKAREVVICEGEINAMSWHQYYVNALATPFGAGGGRKHDWINSEWERLSQFERIYLNFDQDKAGREAVAELSQRLGRHRCFVVPPMPDGCKDINDCLFAGVRGLAIHDLLKASATADPEELRAAVEYTDAVIEEFYPTDERAAGIETPIEALRGKFARRMGEMTIVTGYTGHGKTLLLSWFDLNTMAQGERVCVASFEMRAPVWLKRMVRQATAKREPSTEYIRQVMDWTRDRLWLFDKVGQASRARVLEVFEYAFRRYGVRFFVIDSLMKLDISEDDYAQQTEFANRVANFANEHNVHVTLVAHPRKDDDDEKPAGIQGVKGSNGLINQAHNLLSQWRNKPKENALQKLSAGEDISNSEEKAMKGADAVLLIDKQREGEGWIGRIRMAFDPDSMQYLDEGAYARPVVKFREPEGMAYAGAYQAEDDDYEEVRF